MLTVNISFKQGGIIVILFYNLSYGEKISLNLFPQTHNISESARNTYFCSMKIIGLILLSILLFSCVNKRADSAEDDRPLYSTKYAKNFNIVTHPDFTEVQILNPDNHQLEKKYALVKDPSKLKITSEYIPIQIPLQSIIALAGTDIGMLEKLGVADKIKGVADLAYVYSATVKKNFKKQQVIEIPNFNQLNPEKVAEVAKLITYSGFGTPPTNEEKLNKLGIICIPDYDWREVHPLGKAEWIKLFGLLFDCRDKADAYFSEIEKAYLALEKEAKKFTQRPSVLSGQMIGDQWYMPGGDSYNAYLLEKAKTNYVGKERKGTGSQAYTFEDVLQHFQEADYWINPGFKAKSEMLTANAKYQYFKAFKENKVYCYSHNITYFWEMSAIEPQKVLSDFIHILHPDEVSGQKLYFYKKLAD